VGESKTLVLEYARRSDEMPRVPTTIKHHPASVHVELLSSLMTESKEKLLAKFLTKEFSCVSATLAAKLLKEVRLPVDTEVKALDHKAIVQLAHLMKEVQFDDPPMECLGPVGEYNMRLGIIKELSPDMVATHQDAGCTHEGHPTIVEAGVCLGGKAARSNPSAWRRQR
jgi:DNA topoisomerase-6 subunit B